MKKNIFILLTIFTFFCASCAKAQTLGAGVSVDNQGNLVINAPLYVIDETGDKPVLKLAPSSMNNEVYAHIPWGDGGNKIDVIGGIIKGRLSITIKKPDENWLNDVTRFWGVPDDSFTSGADVRVGLLSLCAKGEVGYGNPSIQLVNTYDLQPIRGTAIGRQTYYFYGNYYEIIYSMGDVNISGKLNLPRWYNWIWHVDFDIHLKQGWNVIRAEDNIKDKNKEEVDTFDKFDKFTSIIPSKDAVWVLLN
jgi:hypothetical protein